MMHILSGRPAAIYRGCQSARAWRDAVERDEPDRRQAALLPPRDAGAAAPYPRRGPGFACRGGRAGVQPPRTEPQGGRIGPLTLVRIRRARATVARKRGA